jgi:TRAP transporter TAXI family solute receptor
MKGPLEVRFLGGGQNWMTLCSRIALGLNGYYSPLPPGSSVSVTTREPGNNCFEGPELVARRDYDIAITTPFWVGTLAAQGRTPYREPLPLCSLAGFAHRDMLVFAVRRETGITSLADIGAKKFPLKVSTPMRETRHPAVWCAERVLEEYGYSLDDIESWGGKVLRDRPRNQKLPGAVPVSDQFDAVFDEAIMTNRWKNLTSKYDLRFLSIDGGILRRLEQQGWARSVLPKGRFRGVDEDVPGIDFTGWYLFTRQDLDEELAYLTIKAIDEQQDEINRLFPDPTSGMTANVDMRALCRDLPLPLHPGAERYYRERGYL